MDVVEKLLVNTSPTAIASVLLIIAWRFILPSARTLFDRGLKHFDILEEIQNSIHRALHKQNKYLQSLNKQFQDANLMSQSKLEHIHNEIKRTRKSDSDSIPLPASPAPFTHQHPDPNHPTPNSPQNPHRHS